MGGTARVVAKGWKTIKQRNPDKNDEEIARTYLSICYGVTGEAHLAKSVLKNLARNRCQINPLNLSWAIFTVENADEALTVLDHSVEWREIMREEIEKLGVKAD